MHCTSALQRTMGSYLFCLTTMKISTHHILASQLIRLLLEAAVLCCAVSVLCSIQPMTRLNFFEDYTCSNHLTAMWSTCGHMRAVLDKPNLKFAGFSPA
ncbi:hypothetical protein OIU78_003074 [Salix suchowensis]|nr:hypothetical protein OIU78_003074 [Salix suchowensis]